MYKDPINGTALQINWLWLVFCPVLQPSPLPPKTNKSHNSCSSAALFSIIAPINCCTLCKARHLRWRCLHPGIQNSAVHKTGQAKYIYKPVHANSDQCRARTRTQPKQTHQSFFQRSVPVFLSTRYKKKCLVFQCRISLFVSTQYTCAWVCILTAKAIACFDNTRSASLSTQLTSVYFSAKYQRLFKHSTPAFVFSSPACISSGSSILVSGQAAAHTNTVGTLPLTRFQNTLESQPVCKKEVGSKHGRSADTPRDDVLKWQQQTHASWEASSGSKAAGMPGPSLSLHDATVAGRAVCCECYLLLAPCLAELHPQDCCERLAHPLPPLLTSLCVSVTSLCVSVTSLCI